MYYGCDEAFAPHRIPRALAFLSAALLAFCNVPAYAGSTSGTFASGTFINGIRPDNNNGGASLIYIGNDFDGGSMRGLIRFNLPSTLNERSLITSASLTMTTGSYNFGSPPAAATVYLQRLTESWGQGVGAGSLNGDFTEGSACTPGGATWNQPFCSGVGWTTPGGTVSGAISGSASVPATTFYSVNWNTPGMASDVQAWAEGSAGNYGWRLLSSTESTYYAIQPFAKTATLGITFACKAGFLELANGSCTTCTAAANTACVTSQAGNTCNDSGPPSTGYSCTCGNAAYVSGPDGTSCVDNNECSINHCTDDGDATAICTDHVAPDTGYSCTCDAGFVPADGTCIDRIFADSFE